MAGILASDGVVFLEAAAGEWSGEYRLWFEPGDPISVSPTHARITTELGGRAAVLRYDWSKGDEPHTGVAMLFARPEGGLEMSLCDTFHSATGILHCTSTGDALDVYTTY